ncbi:MULTISPECIES: hypothetical protein [Saccharopolyspora]|uniref:DUF3618 domain-containing protein n=1 Tax=Saccharopolyspora gregorii TaxID=33914 RepID=A0ABP6RZT1_9PSEU|nr:MULTISPECIES: hypothetical protein [Saccharopolyspora]MCA1186628.1 hypothetical protein [Saccharopolyspora sp. 6T]MCA1191807.1 hypothetical protein [Saccharopolyspora sp. 6V]MCA1227356.1 hypothetical protein [Saccharopolyspora sp. 6M]MCA1281194.1 hypothetical protein [Saccharopolyspora sp. 7B]
MDEVEAMARTGENVGRAVGTGVRTAREGAVRAGKYGRTATKQAIARAEQELTERGLAPEHLPELLAQKATGLSRDDLAERGRKARKQWEKTRKDWDKKTAKSRKRLAKNAEQARKELAKNADQARKELAARIDPAPKSRRKWPWVLLVLAALGGVAVVALSRRPEELPIAEAEDFPTHEDGLSRNPDARPDADR